MRFKTKVLDVILEMQKKKNELEAWNEIFLFNANRFCFFFF